MAKRTNMLYPLGVTITESGAEILVQAEAEKVSLLLFKAGEADCFEQFEFKSEERIGDVWTMSLPGYDFAGLEYGFVADGEWFVDPYAKAVTGRNVWGSLQAEEISADEAAAPKAAGDQDVELAEDERQKPMSTPTQTWPCVRARVPVSSFNWDGDKRPSIPYSETILYRLHVRGLTKHPSSHVRNKGTYAGIVEMIPYFKSLGVTSLELMPVVEFDEVMKDSVPSEIPGGKPVLKPNGKLNYWGYGPAFLYALKAAYGTGFMPVEIEFKIMVKELHDADLECIPEMYFTGEETVGQVLDVLRYWAQEFHVDGFKLSGVIPTEEIAADPFLKDMKLFANDWSSALEHMAKKSGSQNGASGQGGNVGAKKPQSGPVTVREKHLAEYNDKFQMDMRRILRGDQGMVESLMAWSAKNPSDHAVINFMANTNGFTMMDMVSYDEKHNEANGEANRDGTDQNASWNCGIEGPTDVEKINKLRKQQLYNAFLMLMLSQGTPLIMAGDEFGNSQGGNNNAYCQDNETSWLDWNQLDEHADLFQVVREFIRFRKEHKLFHMDHEAKHTDHKSLGYPDVSYHGQSAWRPDLEYFRKQLGIMYWGAYAKKADGTPDETFYVAYNLHWGTHKLGLPRLPKGLVWQPLYDTSGGGALVKGRIYAQVPPYTIVVFVALEETGYCSYPLPIGDVTLVCEKGELIELCFGRNAPTKMIEAGMMEENLPVLEKAYKQLKEYFMGERKEFDLPLYLDGTDFQMKVWEALQTIPYGETRTYKEIATQIGNENASRAVGMANNRNPLPIFIPCHRVVGADGGIVGYAGGTDVKVALLELEKRY